MPLPDITTARGDRGPRTLTPGDVSSLYAAVITARGPVGVPIGTLSADSSDESAVGLYSWPQVRQRVGGHTAYSTLRSIEQYFDQGGSRVVLSRIVGPAATYAVLDLLDGAGRVALRLRAAGPGAGYHDIRATVVRGPGSTRTITITDQGAVVSTGAYDTDIDAKAAIDATGLVVAEIGAGDWPAVELVETPLAGGDDDRAGITDREIADALSPTVLPRQLGPGTLAAPGYTTLAVARALADAAKQTNRFAGFDMPDTRSAGTIIALLDQLRQLGPDAGYLWPLVGWPQINVAGVTVAIPPTGVVAGRMARADREHGPGPGQPAAQGFGAFSSSIVGVSQTYSEADRESINDAGGSVIRADRGQIAPEDAITAADPYLWPQYSEVAGMRVAMAIEHQGAEALRPFRAANLDGRGHVEAQAAAQVIAICEAWYRRGGLYGLTSGEAYEVDVTASVTGPGRRKLTASVAVRNTTSVQRIVLQLTQVATGDEI